MDHLLKAGLSDLEVDLALERAQLGGDDELFSFKFSDAAVDRMGDTIAAAGWELDNFKRNPVILFAHDSDAMPVGKSVATFVSDGALHGVVQFAPSAEAQQVKEFVKGGFLNAVSVGFQPKEFDFADDEERFFGIDFTKQELLETSIVPVPAHPGALLEGRKRDFKRFVEPAERSLAGFDTETLEKEIHSRNENILTKKDVVQELSRGLQEALKEFKAQLNACKTKVTGQLD